MPTTKEVMDCNREPNTCSCVFRIEKLEDCCATFRVLAPNPNATTCNSEFIATDSFFTIDLGCVCAIKCLNDTFVDCL